MQAETYNSKVPICWYNRLYFLGSLPHYLFFLSLFCRTRKDGHERLKNSDTFIFVSYFPPFMWFLHFHIYFFNYMFFIFSLSAFYHVSGELWLISFQKRQWIFIWVCSNTFHSAIAFIPPIAILVHHLS